MTSDLRVAILGAGYIASWHADAIRATPGAQLVAVCDPARDAAEPAGAYARIRLAQLRTGLRDLWLARATVWALLGYALLANAGALWLAGDAWRSAAWELLLVAAAWLVATLWVSRRLRRRWVREYRAVRRLAGV